MTSPLQKNGDAVTNGAQTPKADKLQKRIPEPGDYLRGALYLSHIRIISNARRMMCDIGKIDGRSAFDIFKPFDILVG